MKLKSLLLLFFALVLVPQIIAQQTPPMDSLTRAQLHTMLRLAHEDIKKNYYDPAFHGVDMEALYRQTDAKLDQVQTLNQGFALIAGYTSALNDSHTFFNPPQRTDVSESGFQYKMIGDKGFITHVKPGTDAATKLHPGDQILTYDSFKLERATFPMMSYYFNVLATTKASALQLQAPDGTKRHEVVEHQITLRRRFTNQGYDSGGIGLFNLVRQGEQWEQIIKPRYLDVGGDVLVWKLPEFDQNDQEIDNIFADRIGKHAALIIDLRDNPGGWTETLKYMVGHLFDHDVTIATLVARKPQKPEIAKARGRTYSGKVFVLVDSESGSCSEAFARVMQLEHRGTVIGDRTAGRAMMSKQYGESVGVDEQAARFSFSVTFADLHMADGKSLESVGVTPDILLLPTANDLAEGKDPVLERAVTEAGGTFSQAAVNKAFPFFWPPPGSDAGVP